MREDNREKRESEGGAAEAPAPPKQPSLSPAAQETGKETATADSKNDIERVLACAFLSGHPDPKARAACLDRIGEALRMGATPQLLAWAVISPKLDGKPWDRIQRAGEGTKKLLERCQTFWKKCAAKTLPELFDFLPEKPKGRDAKEQAMLDEILGYRSQAENWPESGPVAGVRSPERRDGPGAARVTS